MEEHVLQEKLSRALQCLDNEDDVLKAVEKLLRDLLDAQERIRVQELQINRLKSRDLEFMEALKCEHHEDPLVAARTLVVMAKDREAILDEAQSLVDPYGDEEGTLPQVLRRIRKDLEISADDEDTSIRDAIESIKSQRDDAISACESLSAELKALKREHADGDACEIAGRILSHALAAMLERPKQ